MDEIKQQDLLAQERQARQQAERLAVEKTQALAQAQAQIQQLTARLEALSQKHAAEPAQQATGAGRATQIFLANMSHELRTPLNAIIGYSDILEEEAKALGHDDFLVDLNLIKSAGKHLQAVIGDILALTKIESGQMDLDLDTFDVSKIVQEAAMMVQLLVNKNGNTLEVNCNGNVGEMQADPAKVQQILFNLLSNAAKFTEHGRITLTAERSPTIPAEITFTVTDTGIGIMPPQMERLFTAFAQADDSTTRKYGGLGLGLTICRHFCQMMGGKITVESEFGRGAVFTVRLPAQVVANG